jgi:hypothetical protein
MSAIGGPDIVEDGLVLALDAANIKSFRGEPTTNLSNGTLSGTIGLTLSTQEVLGPDGNIIVANKANVNSSSGTIRFLMQDSINPPTQGQSYTISVWIKRVGSVEATGGWEPELDNDPIYGYRRPSSESGFFGNYQSNPNIQTIPTDWDRVTYTFSYNIQSTVANRSFFYLSGNGSEVLFYQFQIEAKSYATPFVNGTRGATVATGGGWVDRSGNSNHGELVNGPTYNSSNLGSLVFDGVDDYIQLPYSTYWNTNVFGTATNFTLECWYNPDLFKNWDTLIEKSESPGWYSRPEGASIWTNSTGIQGVFSSGVDSNPAGSNVIITYTTNELRWYHICFTGDGTTLRLYVDGIQRGGNASVSSRTVEVYNGNIGPRLGRRAYMDGKMASVRLYTIGLTASEVLQNYNATKGRFVL